MTIAEAAERFDTAPESLDRAVDARLLGSVTISAKSDGSGVTFLPINDLAVSAWLEEHPMIEPLVNLVAGIRYRHVNLGEWGHHA